MKVFSFITVVILAVTSYLISLQSGLFSPKHIRLILFACTFIFFLFIIHQADTYFSKRKISPKGAKKVENSLQVTDSRAKYLRAKQISKNILENGLSISLIEEARRE